MTPAQDLLFRDTQADYEAAIVAADPADDFGSRSIFSIVGPALKKHEHALSRNDFSTVFAEFKGWLRQSAERALAEADALEPLRNARRVS